MPTRYFDTNANIHSVHSLDLLSQPTDLHEGFDAISTLMMTTLIQIYIDFMHNHADHNLKIILLKFSTSKLLNHFLL